MKTIGSLPITDHAIRRIKLLAGLFDKIALDNMRKINPDMVRTGKFYFIIREFKTVCHVSLDDRNGDTIIAVIQDGLIKTIMLSKSYRLDYFTDGKLYKIRNGGIK